MNLADTHTHLYLDDYNDDRQQVIENAINKGVKYLILPNIDNNSIKPLKELSNQYSGYCYPLMGLHPTSVKEDYEKELTTIKNELAKHKYYGVGEIGIDLYWDKTFREQQTDAFRRQLKLAKQYNIPVSIHTRESFNEAYAIVKDELTETLTGVFHCFTGTAQEAKKIMDIGFYMGIGGVITFKNSKLDEVVKNIPTKHLVLETDSPFLTPVPFRGKRNQSAYITYIAEKVAMVKNEPTEEIAAQTTDNAIRLFKLK